MKQVKRPKINPTQLNLASYDISGIYAKLESDIFEIIAKRLKVSPDIANDSMFKWQSERLNQLRKLNDDTINLLSEATGRAEKDIRKAIDDIGIKSIESIDYEVGQVLPKPTNLERLLRSYANQAFVEMNNFVNQSLITTNFGRGMVATMYERIVSEATAKAITGVATPNKAITETIIKWQREGLKSSFIDKGGRVWNVEPYVRSLVMTTFARTYNDLRMDRMKEHGIDLVLVSSLPDPREACSHIQGTVVTLKPIAENNTGYPSVYEYGYGQPSGTRGINCRHQFFPFIPGVNANNQPQHTKEEMDLNRGLRQKQRYLERQIRAAKKDKNIAEIMGNEEFINRYSKLVRDRQARMREFISETKRTRNYPREQVY